MERAGVSGPVRMPPSETPIRLQGQNGSVLSGHCHKPGKLYRDETGGLNFVATRCITKFYSVIISCSQQFYVDFSNPIFLSYKAFRFIFFYFTYTKSVATLFVVIFLHDAPRPLGNFAFVNCNEMKKQLLTIVAAAAGIMAAQAQ